MALNPFSREADRFAVKVVTENVYYTTTSLQITTPSSNDRLGATLTLSIPGSTMRGVHSVETTHFSIGGANASATVDHLIRRVCDFNSSPNPAANASCSNRDVFGDSLPAASVYPFSCNPFASIDSAYQSTHVPAAAGNPFSCNPFAANQSTHVPIQATPVPTLVSAVVPRLSAQDYWDQLEPIRKWPNYTPALSDFDVNKVFHPRNYMLQTYLGFFQLTLDHARQIYERAYALAKSDGDENRKIFLMAFASAAKGLEPVWDDRKSLHQAVVNAQIIMRRKGQQGALRWEEMMCTILNALAEICSKPARFA